MQARVALFTSRRVSDFAFARSNSYPAAFLRLTEAQYVLNTSFREWKVTFLFLATIALSTMGMLLKGKGDKAEGLIRHLYDIVRAMEMSNFLRMPFR